MCQSLYPGYTYINGGLSPGLSREAFMSVSSHVCTLFPYNLYKSAFGYILLPPSPFFFLQEILGFYFNYKALAILPRLASNSWSSSFNLLSIWECGTTPGLIFNSLSSLLSCKLSLGDLSSLAEKHSSWCFWLI